MFGRAHSEPAALRKKLHKLIQILVYPHSKGICAHCAVFCSCIPDKLPSGVVAVFSEKKIADIPAVRIAALGFQRNHAFNLLIVDCNVGFRQFSEVQGQKIINKIYRKRDKRTKTECDFPVLPVRNHRNHFFQLWNVLKFQVSNLCHAVNISYFWKIFEGRAYENLKKLQKFTSHIPPFHYLLP